MEFKGTKGEWNISKDINDNERVCIVSDSNDNFIDCWSLQFCSEEEMRANAQLIATAPELLKALQIFKNAVDNEDIVMYDNLDHDGLESTPSKIYNLINKTINKSLGND